MEPEYQPLYPNENNSATLKESLPLSSTSTSAPVTHQPTLLTPPTLLLGPHNTLTSCPFCSACVKTSIRHTTTTRTHVLALTCSLFCCCSCLPYCMDSARNSDHYCPNCQRYLGTYQK